MTTDTCAPDHAARGRRSARPDRANFRSRLVGTGLRHPWPAPEHSEGRTEGPGPERATRMSHTAGNASRMSTPIWPATVADDHTHRTLVRDWLTEALTARQFPVDAVVVDTHGDGALTDVDLHLADVVVRFTRLADLPEQQLVAIGHRDPGPYGRISWTNAADGDLGAAVLRGDRHRDPQLVGETLRATVFGELEAAIATHHLDDRVLRPEPVEENLPPELQPAVLGVRRRGDTQLSPRRDRLATSPKSAARGPQLSRNWYRRPTRSRGLSPPRPPARRRAED